jgi:hypothetical protein
MSLEKRLKGVGHALIQESSYPSHGLNLIAVVSNNENPFLLEREINCCLQRSSTVRSLPAIPIQ